MRIVMEDITIRHIVDFNPELIRDTLIILLKFEEDIEIVQEHLYDMTRKAVKGA